MFLYNSFSDWLVLGIVVDDSVSSLVGTAFELGSTIFAQVPGGTHLKPRLSCFIVVLFFPFLKDFEVCGNH